MKIIFLDIDGVLNSQLYYGRKPKRKKEQTKEDYHLQNIDSVAVGFLNDLVKETGAKVVISSTWRMGNEMPYLQSLLSQKGFTGEIIAYTPILNYEGAVRGNEIYLWIQKNAEMLCGSNVGADFKDYVIFDDDSDMLWWQRNNFIHIDPYAGLTPNHCYRAKYILCSDMTFGKSFEKTEQK